MLPFKLSFRKRVKRAKTSQSPSKSPNFCVRWTVREWVLPCNKQTPSHDSVGGFILVKCFSSSPSRFTFGDCHLFARLNENLGRKHFANNGK